MDARSYTAEERRAANQVWAAAGAYGFEPLSWPATPTARSIFI